MEHVNHPFSVAVFEDRLYWSDWHSQEVQSANKFTGKNFSIVTKKVNARPMGIALSHPLLQDSKMRYKWVLDRRVPGAERFGSKMRWLTNL